MYGAGTLNEVRQSDLLHYPYHTVRLLVRVTNLWNMRTRATTLKYVGPSPNAMSGKGPYRSTYLQYFMTMRLQWICAMLTSHHFTFAQCSCSQSKTKPKTLVLCLCAWSYCPLHSMRYLWNRGLWCCRHASSATMVRHMA